MRTVLQVPMNIDLRREAKKKALEQGFSSLQDAVRMFLKKLSRGVIEIALNDKESVQLSARAIKRYNKISEDFRRGRNVYAAKNADDLIRQLNENSLS